MKVNAYPNPFSSSATIEFMRDDKSSHVKIGLYSLSGEKVADIFDADIEAGVQYKTEFKSDNLTNGIYIYRIECDDAVLNGKLTLIH
jgi:hypothetical protein